MKRTLKNLFLLAGSFIAGISIAAAQPADDQKKDQQTASPLRPMLASLRENLPSLAEFDGVTLDRAHHDATKQLVLSARAIDDTDPGDKDAILKKVNEQTALLKDLLETNPRWRLHTTGGLVLNITKREKPNLDQANKNVMSALHLLQVNIGEAHVEEFWPAAGWMSHAWPFDPKLPRVKPTNDDYDRSLQYLDAALLHNPKGVLAWYLRGYVLQTKNRADLTLRDYRRMVELELDDPELRHKRILDLELVQGSLRQSAYRIEQDAILQVSDGWTLEELRERPAAREGQGR